MEAEEPRVLTAAGVAELFGITRTRVNQLRREGDMPEPIYAERRVVTLWDADEIRAWGVRHGYLNDY